MDLSPKKVAEFFWSWIEYFTLSKIFFLGKLQPSPHTLNDIWGNRFVRNGKSTKIIVFSAFPVFFLYFRSYWDLYKTPVEDQFRLGKWIWIRIKENKDMTPIKKEKIKFQFF